ncbi:glycerophosphodiester phosphodiesterase [Bowmanella denitrificans]|uniref:glycerophosphodiester phosphodiesterase n=1 Tax=Bowmanella denitrificans TaxID=366582 RepID=UPI000C9AD030|nr:glycerophosphodiester phosphodiesterase [Bowmanella denitrificans]
MKNSGTGRYQQPVWGGVFVRRIAGLFILLALIAVSPLQAEPLVIAHRGVSGYLPEHSLEGVILAHGMGVDYIEQDLFVTRDDQLVVLHDPYLEHTTDIARRFPERVRADGHYYALDFTLDELQSLSLTPRPHLLKRMDGNTAALAPLHARISSFDEQIRLIRYLNRARDMQVGLYPEIKKPALHRQQGKDISRLFLAALERHQLNQASAKVIVQCFDFAEVKRLRQLGLKTQLVQLIGAVEWADAESDFAYLQSKAGVAAMAQVVDGVGPWHRQLYHLDNRQPSDFAKWLKQAGLQIHPYTLNYNDTPQGMPFSVLQQLLFDIVGVDGVFTDYADRILPGPVRPDIE